MTFRELPCTYVPVIIDLDAGWSIADGRRPERPPERLGSFVAGLTDGPVIVSHAGTARCLQVDLAPLAARRLLGVPMSELANRSVDLGTSWARRPPSWPSGSTRAGRPERRSPSSRGDRGAPGRGAAPPTPAWPGRSARLGGERRAGRAIGGPGRASSAGATAA